MRDTFESDTRALRVPRPSPQTRDTVCIRAWRRGGGRQISRAQVRLGRAPAFAAALASSLSTIEAGLFEATQLHFGLEGVLSAESVMPSALLERHAVWALIELPVSGARAVVELDEGVTGPLFERLGLAPRWSTAQSLTAPTERALAKVFLAAIGAVAEVPAWTSGFGPRLAGIFTERSRVLGALDIGARHLSIWVRAVQRGRVFYPRILVPGRAVEVALLKARVRRRQTPTPSAIANAEIEATVVAGRGVLSLSQIQRLTPGEAVQISGLGWHAGKLVGAARLRTAGFEAHGALFPRGLELSRFHATVSPEERPMSDDLSHSLLPIEVEIELTRLRMPLSEVATLRPGAVLPLRQYDDDPVTLKVGGRPIARAELVDIDGEVGARILQLLEREDGR